ncbi:hypothetical protein FRC09_016180, partial [Ceratobasidium sp. 395]
AGNKILPHGDTPEILKAAKGHLEKHPGLFEAWAEETKINPAEFGPYEPLQLQSQFERMVALAQGSIPSGSSPGPVIALEASFLDSTVAEVANLEDYNDGNMDVDLEGDADQGSTVAADNEGSLYDSD